MNFNRALVSNAFANLEVDLKTGLMFEKPAVIGFPPGVLCKT